MQFYTAELAVASRIQQASARTVAKQGTDIVNIRIVFD